MTRRADTVPTSVTPDPNEQLRRALYIGRFQVFHLGHLDVLGHIAAAADVDEILIALGSTQYDHTRRSPVAPWAHNPFTAGERIQMLEAALAPGLGKPWAIHGVPDYHDWEAWFAHLRTHLPHFMYLYTSDRLEAAFFGSRGVEVRGFPRLRAFHAGALRERMAAGDPSYRAAVPGGVLAILDGLAAEARLSELMARDRAEASASQQGVAR